MKSTDSAIPFDDIRALVARIPGPDFAAVEAVRARDAVLTKPAGSLGRLEEIVEWLAAWQGKAPPAVNRAAGRDLRRQSRRRRPRRLGVPAVGDPPDGREFRRRRRRDQPDLPRLRSRAEGLRPRARPADRRHHRRSGARRGGLRRDDGLRHGSDGGRRRSPLHRRNGDRQHHRRRGDLRRAVRRRSPKTGSGPAPGSTPTGSPASAARSPMRMACHDGHLGDPLEVLRRVGGREIAAMAGAILAARHNRVPVIVDGYVATAAAAVLHALDDRALDHCLFGHVSAEPGHLRALSAMNKSPLLDLGMRLGEGDGRRACRRHRQGRRGDSMPAWRLLPRRASRAGASSRSPRSGRPPPPATIVVDDRRQRFHHPRQREDRDRLGALAELRLQFERAVVHGHQRLDDRQARGRRPVRRS